VSEPALLLYACVHGKCKSQLSVYYKAIDTIIHHDDWSDWHPIILGSFHSDHHTNHSGDSAGFGSGTCSLMSPALATDNTSRNLRLNDRTSCMCLHAMVPNYQMNNFKATSHGHPVATNIEIRMCVSDEMTKTVGTGRQKSTKIHIF